MLSNISPGNKTQAIGHPFWSILWAYVNDFDTESSTCADDDVSTECNTVPVWDFTLTFDALDELSAASGTFPSICTNYYALGTLASMLDSVLANYSAANSGYDSVFGDYLGVLSFFLCTFCEASTIGLNSFSLAKLFKDTKRLTSSLTDYFHKINGSYRAVSLHGPSK
jgi:hypothetical protein